MSHLKVDVAPPPLSVAANGELGVIFFPVNPAESKDTLVTAKQISSMHVAHVAFMVQQRRDAKRGFQAT